MDVRHAVTVVRHVPMAPSFGRRVGRSHVRAPHRAESRGVRGRVDAARCGWGGRRVLVRAPSATILGRQHDGAMCTSCATGCGCAIF